MYYIELNAMIVRGYASLKRAEALYQKYAQNPDNLVRIWNDGEVIKESTSEDE